MCCIDMDGVKQCPEASAQEGWQRRNCGLKKIKTTVQTLKVIHRGKKIRFMFQDEVKFGRINRPKYCWYEKRFVPMYLVTTSGSIAMPMEQWSR